MAKEKSAVRAKLESYKRPNQGKVMGGHVSAKDQYAPKNAPPAKMNTSLLRMALSQGRRGEAEFNKQMGADSLGLVRKGTMDRDGLMLQHYDDTIAGIDELLQSLGAQ